MDFHTIFKDSLRLTAKRSPFKRRSEASDRRPEGPVVRSSKGKKKKGNQAMTEKKEITGKFRYEQDSKRYHRFKIETVVGIVGTVYVPKDLEAVPKKLVLKYEGKA
jgi:hypothetical protein